MDTAKMVFGTNGRSRSGMPIMQKSQIIEILSRTELFMGLSDQNLTQVENLPSCVAKSYRAGEYVFEKGEVADDLMVIIHGRVNIVSETTPPEQETDKAQSRRKRIERITKGGTLGISALIPPSKRGLSAIADTDAEVLSINAKELMELFERKPKIGYEVLRSLIRVLGSKILNVENMIVQD
jgi:CRP/FNR family transcriptional regulator, cyclic AMP receptor protein